MNFKTKIEQLDTDEIVNSEYINWDFYKDSTILVTGATGLIGYQTVLSILRANETLNSNIKILALVRNKEKALKKFRANKSQLLKFVVQDIIKPIKMPENVDYIIHTANSTSSKGFVEEPVETINSIIEGTKNILEFSKNKNVKSVVYLSSMEVFGRTDFDKPEPLKENDYGYIDIAELRSSYPEGKRLAENMCLAYAKEYNVPVKVARLVQTIGAGVDYNDNRVFVQFARNIVERKDIVLHTTGESVRSYCYLTDTISALFVLMERGENGEFYNVSNPETTCSIKEMAEELCKKYASSNLIFELENSMNNYYLPKLKTVLNIDKISNLSWQPKINIEEMFNRLIRDFYMRQKKIVKKVSQERKPILKSLCDWIFSIKNNDFKKNVTVFGIKFHISRTKKGEKICCSNSINPKKIVFADLYSNGFGGHSKYIVEEIKKRNLPYEIVWLTKENDKNFPEYIKTVNYNSYDALKELATAKVWVDSNQKIEHLKKGLIKKEGQYYVQLWHGSLGIKKFGFDICPLVEEDWMQVAKKDAEITDYLVSNAKFETDVYRSAFWGYGNIVELGHARNDVFYQNNDDIVSKIKNYFNIASEEKIILYAPSFRDDYDTECFDIDYIKLLDSFNKKFGAQHKLIIRLHPRLNNYRDSLIPTNEYIIDGTIYDDMQELLIASDIVITDYSSCIFDFVLTNKPGFIYASDLEKYNNSRGFYYPIENTPFPIATNMDDFLNKIDSFDENEYKIKVKEFLLEKGCIDDGHSSERIVEFIKELMEK